MKTETFMNATQPDPEPTARDDEPGETSLGDVVDGAVRKIVTALVIASGILALAIYSRPGPPRFQVFAADGQIIRIDTRSGTILACEADRCMRIVKRGQHLVDSLESKPLPKRDALPAQAPPPAAAPAPR
jgi:hypothetical protein